MKLNKLIIFTLILFIFPFVNASNDYSAVMFSGGSQMCTCTSIEDIITITNNQPMPIAYTLSLSGNFENFYTLSEDFIVIEPFERKEIIGFINPRCGFYGRGSVDIKIEPNVGEEKTITRNLQILNCENNRLNFRVANHFINNPCTETIYPLTVTNIGDYAEIYDFSVEGLDSRYVSFSHNSVFLQPGESLDFNAYILMPCENFGDFTGNFVSTAQNSNLVSKVPFKLTLERLYNFSMSLGYYDGDEQIFIDEYNYNYCAGLEYKIPVKVNNEVFISNAYDIKLHGDYWFTSDARRIELFGETSGTFNLTARPTKENIGNYRFPLEINSVRGDLTVNADININVIDCSSFNIYVDYNPVACCGKNTYNLIIENEAHTENEIFIETDAYISNNTFVLQPNETKSIEIEFDLSCDEYNEFYLNASNFIESKEIKVPFETYSVKECQKLVLDSRESEIIFYEWKEIPLVFKNVGIRGSNYSTTLEAPDWVTIDDEEFYLDVNEKKVINLYVDPQNYSEQKRYYINIIHVSDNGYGHFNQFVIELKEWNIKDATYLFIRNNKGIAILFLLILIVLILLLIYFIKDFKRKQKEKSKKDQKESKKAKKKRNYKMIFGWILLLLLLIGLAVYFLYYFESKDDEQKEINETIIYNETINETIDVIINETTNETIIIKPEEEKIPPEEEKHQYLVENNLLDSFLYHSWYKDEVLELDLDNNFEDPDGEPLSYTSSIPQNIDVFIDGSIVYLTPKQNWTGIEKIYFRATDTAGDYVISPEITLIVREKSEEEKNVFENLFENLGLYTKLYLFYVIIGVILLLIILLVLSRRSNNNNKKNKKK